jgi:hypothetical protein
MKMKLKLKTRFFLNAIGKNFYVLCLIVLGFPVWWISGILDGGFLFGWRAFVILSGGIFC